ncbi:trunk [Plakobranchus ocellatus]|uniref:Trunk n=1 Tax=Plakobranchus ocellatus TaxID=259542 RepID=A0AAV3Z453_9GAST|nr:trunk [Plakobranchus ocellatus]
MLHCSCVRRDGKTCRQRARVRSNYSLTTLSPKSVVSQVFHIFGAVDGKGARPLEALLQLITVLGERSARSRHATPTVAICTRRPPLPKDAPCCRRRMPLLPAGAPRGDPDMTRRLSDRAHVRRQGQTRCFAERPFRYVHPDPTTLTPSLHTLYSSHELARLSGGVPSSISTCCFSVRQASSRTFCACQKLKANRDQSPGNIPTSPSSTISNSLSCSCKPLPPSSIQRLSERPLLSHTPQLWPGKVLQTGRANIFAIQNWQKSDTQIQNQCGKESRTAASLHRHRLVPSSLFVLFVVMLLPCLLFASPTSTASQSRKTREQENPNELILRSPLCKPVSPEDLRRMMGSAYDPSRMASDVATAKRNFLSDDPNLFDSAVPPGYQGDDPGVSRVSSSDELDLYTSSEDAEWESDEGLSVEHREVDEDFYSDEQDVEEEIEEDEDTIWRSRYIETDVKVSDEALQPKHRRRNHKWEVDKSEKHYQTRQRVVADPYAYMKRRRRKRSPDSARGKLNATPKTKDNVNSKYNARDRRNSYNRKGDNKDSGDRGNGRFVGANYLGERRQAKGSSDVGVLPLKLALSGKNKALRRTLKKQFRQQAKNLRKRPPPWECKMSTKTLIMNQGVFPRVIVDGHCVAKKCFYRLYDCAPQRFTIRIMQRDPDHCVPLPTIGNSTVFEERWNLVSRRVTVGCNCVNTPIINRRPTSAGRRRTHRKKTRGKKLRLER